MDFADTIRAARKAAGKSRKKLGEDVGVSKSAIFAWEHREYVPDIGRLERLAQVLRLELSDLSELAAKAAALHAA